jgi:hypothetical protein
MINLQELKEQGLIKKVIQKIPRKLTPEEKQSTVDTLKRLLKNRKNYNIQKGVFTK